jgi:methionine-rich copper-binding protein CopC
MTPQVRRIRFLLPVASLAFAFVAPLGVLAHAELDTHEPGAGETVVGTPAVIHATYTETLDPTGSSLLLVDADGAKVAQGGVADASTPTKEMSITDLPDLAPGEYTVRSTTKSADDGDIDRKTWVFTVTAPSPTPAPTTAPSAPPSAAPSASPIPSATPVASVAPSPSGDTGTPTTSTSDVILPIIVGLAFVAIVGGYLLMRRRPPANG